MSFKAFLRQLNHMPFPVTIRHYVSYGLPLQKFKDGVMRSGESWMLLRNEHPYYRIPDTREEWLRELTYKKDGQDEGLRDRVASFAALLEREGIRTVYSIGSGGGIFEYYLKKHAPHVKVIGTEYTKEGVERLRRVCTELDDVWFFDALQRESWKKLGNDKASIVFIYRNEREFSDADWKRIWESMYDANVERVFLGLMWTLTLRAWVQLRLRNLMKRLAGEKLIFTGYLRNLEGLRRFGKDKYAEKESITFPTCTGLYLTRYSARI
jgi:hypothetical protein